MITLNYAGQGQWNKCLDLLIKHADLSKGTKTYKSVYKNKIYEKTHTLMGKYLKKGVICRSYILTIFIAD